MPVKNIMIAITFLDFTFALYQGIGAWHVPRAVPTPLSYLHFHDQAMNDALSGHAPPQLRVLVPGFKASYSFANSLYEAVLIPLCGICCALIMLLRNI